MKKINNQSFNIIRALTQLEENVVTLIPESVAKPKEMVEIYIGVIYGKSIPIPAERFNHVKNDYVAKYQSMIMDSLGTLNEMYVINIDNVLDVTYQIWEQRYFAVHGNGINLESAIDLLLDNNAKSANDPHKAEKLTVLRSIASGLKVNNMPFLSMTEYLFSDVAPSVE